MKEYTKNQVHEVACAFNEHKIIALPTDTVYGVGVKYGNLDDLERLKRAKHRPETKPIPMMVSNVEQMKQVALVDERIEKIAAKFLPIMRRQQRLSMANPQMSMFRFLL